MPVVKNQKTTKKILYMIKRLINVIEKYSNYIY